MEFNYGRKYGVEIEINTTDKDGNSIYLSTITTALVAAGINAQTESLNHQTRDYWKVTTDGSCGYEIVSPVLVGIFGLDEIKKVCDVLKALGCKVDKTCGLHVHVDANDFNVTQIAKIIAAYARNEKFFDSLVPESRRKNNNRYCQSVIDLMGLDAEGKKNFSHDPIRVFSHRVGDRYYKINPHSYPRHGSLEFRQHSGTISAEKICNWVVLLVGFVEATYCGKLSLHKSKVSFQSFKNWIHLFSTDADPLIAECARWTAARFAEFNPNIHNVYEPL